MWRWTGRILIGLCAGLTIAACSGAAYQWVSTRKELAETPLPGRLVDVGGHRLHIWCTGAGHPSVVIETGLRWVDRRLGLRPARGRSIHAGVLAGV